MRLCVTGGTGFVGSNIVSTALATRDVQILATSHTWPSDRSAGATLEIVKVDMRDAPAFGAVISEFAPTVIVHCAIDNADFGAMERDNRIAWQSFVEPVVRLAEVANRLSARLIQVSTDWVFDGRSPMSSEESPASPVNLVGRMKLATERVVLNQADRASVARISGVNGPHRMRPDFSRAQNQGFGHFIAAGADALLRGDTFDVWSGGVTEVANPSHAEDCAEMILRVAERDLDGVFHCCGTQAVSRIELANALTMALGLPADMVVERSDLPATARHQPIPPDTSLDNTTTRAALAYEPLTVNELVDAVIRDRSRPRH